MIKIYKRLPPDEKDILRDALQMIVGVALVLAIVIWILKSL